MRISVHMKNDLQALDVKPRQPMAPIPPEQVDRLRISNHPRIAANGQVDIDGEYISSIIVGDEVVVRLTLPGLLPAASNQWKDGQAIEIGIGEDSSRVEVPGG